MRSDRLVYAVALGLFGAIGLLLEMLAQPAMGGADYPIRIELAPSKPAVHRQVSERPQIHASNLIAEKQSLQVKSLAQVEDPVSPALETTQSSMSVASSQRLSEIDFRLASSNEKNLIEVEKSLIVDGLARGKVSLFINNANSIAVSSADIRRSVPALGEVLREENEKIDFKTIRAAGIRIRYDATNDRVVVSTDISDGFFE